MVMAPSEMTTDVPEQRRLKNDPKTDWDRRARGLGGRLSSCGEENLLNLKGDRYNRENILIHEFNHAIHQQGLKEVDPTFFDGPTKANPIRTAMDKGVVEGHGTWLPIPRNTGRRGPRLISVHAAPQFRARNTREKLKEYDPDLFALVDEVYKQSKFRYVRYDKRK